MTNAEGPLSFPDGPRGRLDVAIADLVAQANEVLLTQGRLRSLLQANRALGELVDLPTVLRRIVEAAVDLVDAQYGALGVIAPDGHLQQFIHVGINEELAARIGHLPEGHGLLGALIEEPEPIRLEHLGSDPRSVGFPPQHPPMDSFLGVPVRVRNEIYGNLYLSNQSTGSFSAEDQDLLAALAATAGIAIDNARLFDLAERRQRWSAASAEVVSALVSTELEGSLGLVADRVAELADADLVCVLLPTMGGELAVDTARGADALRVVGTTLSAQHSLAARAMEGGQPFLWAEVGAVAVSDGGEPLALGAAMLIPLMAAGRPSGVLAVARDAGRARFTEAELEMASDFAGQASLALELARGRADRQRLELLEDRSRIARDLHDHVIQRLFASGLGLQSVAGLIADPTLRARIEAEVTTMDEAIAQIRTAVFALTTQPPRATPSLRHRIMDAVSEQSVLGTANAQLSFSGAIDLLVPEAMAADLIAVVREGVTNAAKHANATDTTVSVRVEAGVVSIVIEDDGVGPGDSPRRSGVANLLARAQKWHGASSLIPRASGGSRLEWTAPISEESQ